MKELRSSRMFKETLSSVVTDGVGLEPSPSNPRKPVHDGMYYLEPTANLMDLANSLRLSTKPCKPQWKVLECDCGRRVLKSGCYRSNCPICAGVVRQRRSKRAFIRFHLPNRGQRHLTERPTVCYTVFTVPKDIRYKFFDVYEWQKVRKAVWHLLKTKFGAVFGLEASHPIGDKSDEFHPHLNFVWRPAHKREAFINVTLLRTLWAQLLGVSSADVNHQYSDSHWKIKHTLNYVLRTFPEFTQWCGCPRWYGSYPIAPKPEKWLCPDCGKPIYVIGTIDNEFIENYNNRGFLMGRDPPWMIEDNINRFKRKKTVCDK